MAPCHGFIVERFKDEHHVFSSEHFHRRLPLCEPLHLGRVASPRPVASECVCYWLRNATGLDCGDRSWICNAPLVILYIGYFTGTLLRPFLTSLPKVIWKEGRASRRCRTHTPKSPHWLQWRTPNSPPKVPISVDQSPNPITCLIPGPVRSMMQNGIRIRSAVLPHCTGQTDGSTDARTYVRTDRSSTGKFDDYRPLRSESDAA